MPVPRPDVSTRSDTTGSELDLHALLRFLTVTEAGSFAEASRLLGVSRQAVHRSIDALEKECGGPLIDLGVHILDLTLHLMGYPKPVAVTGSTWDTLGKDPNVHNFFGPYDRSKFTVEDFAVGSILFDNGARVNLESSFMSNGEGDPYQTQLYGVGAGAKLVPFADPPLQIFKEVDQQMFTMTPARLPQMPKMHTAEVQAFVAAIRSGAPSPVPPEQGVMLTAILSAIYESAELGREVPVHLDL